MTSLSPIRFAVQLDPRVLTFWPLRGLASIACS